VASKTEKYKRGMHTGFETALHSPPSSNITDKQSIIQNTVNQSGFCWNYDKRGKKQKLDSQAR